MPAASRAMGACSRDEPQPKFLPATMILYGETNSSSVWKGTCPLGSPAWAGGTLLRAYLPNCRYSSGMDGSKVRYWAGMIWSVSTLSPRTKALPVMIGFKLMGIPWNKLRPSSLRPSGLRLDAQGPKLGLQALAPLSLLRSPLLAGGDDFPGAVAPAQPLRSHALVGALPQGQTEVDRGEPVPLEGL